MMFDIKIEVWGEKRVQNQGYIVDILNYIINAIQSTQRVFFFFFQVEESWYFERGKKSQIGHI